MEIIAHSEKELKLANELVKVVSFKEIEQLMGDQSGDLQVINFWATWCRPCVAELPDFEKANKKYEAKGVKMTLVSLDFSDQLQTKVIPFVKKKGLKADVLLLDNDNYDSWIGKVSKDWDGAIPATLFINKKKGIRKMVVGSMHYEDLDATISQFL